jgi:hypothetical protein
MWSKPQIVLHERRRLDAHHAWDNTHDLRLLRQELAVLSQRLRGGPTEEKEADEPPVKCGSLDDIRRALANNGRMDVVGSF